MANRILNKRIGIIGCGSMGLPMLKNIIQKRINASGYDIKNKKYYFDIKNNIIFSVVRDVKETEEICKLVDSHPKINGWIKKTYPKNY